MGSEPSSSTYQPYRSREFSPENEQYRRWMGSYMLFRIPQCNYNAWKSWALKRKDLKYWYAVISADGYMYIYIKWHRDVIMWSNQNECYMRPYRTFKENMNWLYKKGRLYEHKRLEGNPKLWTEDEKLSEADTERLIDEAIEETKRGNAVFEKGEQLAARCANQSIDLTEDKPTEQAVHAQKRPAKEILELTPEQALEQLTLEEYDLYCKYKK